MIYSGLIGSLTGMKRNESPALEERDESLRGGGGGYDLSRVEEGPSHRNDGAL